MPSLDQSELALRSRTRGHLPQQYSLEAQHFAQAPQAFFRYWKSAVRLAGARFFGAGRLTDPHLATCKEDLQPNLELIGELIQRLRPDEQVFLATMVGFYDRNEGKRLLQSMNVATLADCVDLDFQQRTLIAGLLLNYTGWERGAAR